MLVDPVLEQSKQEPVPLPYEYGPVAVPIPYEYGPVTVPYTKGTGKNKRQTTTEGRKKRQEEFASEAKGVMYDNAPKAPNKTVATFLDRMAFLLRNWFGLNHTN